jgi:hypothetical protein
MKRVRPGRGLIALALVAVIRMVIAAIDEVLVLALLGVYGQDIVSSEFASP